MAQTSIVILNYNGEDYLKKFLPSVIKYSENAEIVVADNKSADNSIEVLKNQFLTVKIIALDQNYGYAGGYNKAIQKIESDYVVLLNSDIEVTEGWLYPLISFLDKSPSYAACQPKIKDFNQKSHFEYAGASGGFLDILGYPYCRGRIFDNIEVDTSQYNDQVDIFWASGACLVIRNELFKQAGGLDADFFAHMEEIDLCWRIKSMGYKIRVLPESAVYHVGGGTLSKISPFKTLLNFRNGLYMLIKNLPLIDLIWKVPLRILLDWVAAIKFIVEGNGKHGVAVLKAHLQTLLSLKKTIKKRHLFSRTGSLNFIVFKYYLKKRRKFDEI